MKILLGYCVEPEHSNDYYITLLPVGLVSIASYLSHQGWDVTLANFSKKKEGQILHEIRKEKPAIIGFSLYTHNRFVTFSVVNAIKKAFPHIVIVLGGPHATYLSKEIVTRYPAVNYVVEGEGEIAMYTIAKAVANKKKLPKIVTSSTPVDVTKIPYPAQYTGRRINVNDNEQFKYIITSRGCSFNCTFCDSPSYWGRNVRFRDIDDVIDEIETLYKKYGIIYFSVRDDNFLLKKNRVLDFSEKLQKKKLYMMWNCQARVDTVDENMLIAMKKAGLEHIQYGVESGSSKILALYNKKTTVEDVIRASQITRRVGVYLSIYLMVGMKGETYADIKKTKMLIAKILPGDCVVSPVALYPGTALYEQEKNSGNIRDSIWFKNQSPGIFLRNEPIIKEWMNELLITTYTLRNKAWYSAKDFTKHRKLTGDCWVTDVLEGDYYLDSEMYPAASQLYAKVINAMPDNPWGYMRYGKLHFTIGEYETASESFNEVTKIVPQYYGGWLKYAQSLIALGQQHKATHAIKKASELNPFDPRVRNLTSLLQKNKKNLS